MIRAEGFPFLMFSPSIDDLKNPNTNHKVIFCDGKNVYGAQEVPQEESQEGKFAYMDVKIEQGPSNP